MVKISKDDYLRVLIRQAQTGTVTDEVMTQCSLCYNKLEIESCLEKMELVEDSEKSTYLPRHDELLLRQQQYFMQRTLYAFRDEMEILDNERPS